MSYSRRVLDLKVPIVGVVLGAQLSSIRDLIREELSLHALLVTGEQLLVQMLIKRSLKVVVNFFVGSSVYKSVQSIDILMRMVLMLRCSRG